MECDGSPLLLSFIVVVEQQWWWAPVERRLTERVSWLVGSGASVTDKVRGKKEKERKLMQPGNYCKANLSHLPER